MIRPGPYPAIAMVGCGYWGQNLLRNLAALGVLRAVCDLDPAVAARAGETTGVPAVSLDEVLSSDRIDAVVIATPATTHADLATRALRAGKHTFVEKPLALDVERGAALCDLAETRHLTLMVGHLLRYHPAFLRLHELAGAGELGRLQYVYSNRLNLGKVRREENILWSFAPHDISMILALFDQEPERVTATGSCFLHETIADVTTTHLAFPGGPQAHIFVSWLHPIKEQRLVVVGDRGMAVFDDGRPWEDKLVFYRHEMAWQDGVPEPVRADPEAVPLKQDEPLEQECRHFVECITTGSRPRTDGREGLRVLRVLAAAETAMRAGTPEAPVRPGGDGVLVHPSAFVDADVSIGPGTRVWHVSHLLPGSRIGTGCTIGQNVVIGPDVVIGDGCKIQNNVSVYHGVTLEDDVFCGPGCVFTNVSNPRAHRSRSGDFAPTVVRRGATIGANATVVCGHEIGAYAFIAAGAVVAGDVRAHALVAGVPARQIGWMSHDGERLGDDLICPFSRRHYRVEHDTLVEVGDGRHPGQATKGGDDGGGPAGVH